MAKLFKVTVATGSKEVQVVAESSEEAQTKVPAVEGETVVKVEEVGEVIV